MAFHNFVTFALYFVALVSFRCSCLSVASDEDLAYIQYITPLSSGPINGRSLPGKRAEKSLSGISGSPGNVKKYDWELTWEMGAPNGNPRMMIFTNGQFPGPNLVVDEGDTIEVIYAVISSKQQADQVQVTLHNKLPFNTTIHWHGMAYAILLMSGQLGKADKGIGSLIHHGPMASLDSRRNQSNQTQLSSINLLHHPTELTGTQVLSPCVVYI